MPAARERGGDLVAERLATLDGEPVQVPLAGEGQRPVVERLEQAAAPSGRPARRRCRGQTVKRAPSSSSRASTAGSASVGTKTCSVAPARRGHDGGRERGVAAARDREVGAPGRDRRARAAPPPRARARTPKRCRALCEPDDVARLVLDPDAAPLGEAELLAELAASGRGAWRRSRARRRRRPAGRADARCAQNSSSVRPACDGDVVRAQEGAVADERVGLRVVRAGSAPPRGRARAGGRGRRRRPAAPSGQRKGYGSRGVGLGAAAGADEAAGGCGHSDSSTPVRALNSSISASHSPDEVVDAAPEGGAPAGLEVLERDALLLDPGVVAEVEDPLPVDARELEQVVGRRAEQVLAEHLGGGDLVEAVGEVALASASSCSLPYMPSPSVATVTITSSGPMP